jgi:hypothetical protein
LRRFLSQSCLFPVLLFSLLGFLAMGYHPGAEDDAVYLSAVQARVNPSLYPHDSAFFLLQMRTSIFDTGMANLIRATGLTVAWAELLIHALSIVLLMFAAWKILCLMFEETAARWGGMAMLAAMFTLPVAGTALYITDQYLHPRNPATALILLGVDRIMRGKRWQAVPLLLLAFALHPLMGALGVSFCFVLTLTFSEPVRNQVRSWRERFAPQGAEAATPTPVAAFFPFAWIFSKPTPSYTEAMISRHAYQLFKWTWYEWLGAIGPLVIFWAVARIARKQGQMTLSRFATAAFLYGAFQQAVAMLLLNPKDPLTFYTLEPMRYLQLIYLFMTLVLGAYIGKYLLKASTWRWAIFLLVANGGMAYAQRQLFPFSHHIELPGEAPVNPWVQAFDWIKQNTPQDAYFAVDPYYMTAPGNDNHSFRALAERSVLADAVKDPGIVTKEPELGAAWASQVQAASGWKHFQRGDFERLKAEFGVDWALVNNAQADGLDCRWHNDMLSVCRIP